MKMKDKLQILTNVICMGIGYSFTQDNILVYKIIIVVLFILWFLTQTMYNNNQ